MSTESTLRDIVELHTDAHRDEITMNARFMEDLFMDADDVAAVVEAAEKALDVDTCLIFNLRSVETFGSLVAATEYATGM